MNYLENFYNNYDEDGRLRSKHGLVEFATTMKYVHKYLKDGDRVLEIGAGTGRYSHALAQEGYAVDAVELVQHNIDVFNANTKSGEKITVTQGNALDLSEFADNTYDVTLLLGPMYHLYTEKEQLKALSEALRVTKKGGIVFVAYCISDATVIQFCFERGGIKDEHFKQLIDPVTFKTKSNPEDIFQMYRKEDIDSLMKSFSVERLHYVGTDMATGYMREAVDNMDDELFETYLNYHFYICERADMLGMTQHSLDIFKKL